VVLLGMYMDPSLEPLTRRACRSETVQNGGVDDFDTRHTLWQAWLAEECSINGSINGTIMELNTLDFRRVVDLQPLNSI